MLIEVLNVLDKVLDIKQEALSLDQNVLNIQLW